MVLARRGYSHQRKETCLPASLATPYILCLVVSNLARITWTKKYRWELEGVNRWRAQRSPSTADFPVYFRVNLANVHVIWLKPDDQGQPASEGLAHIALSCVVQRIRLVSSLGAWFLLICATRKSSFSRNTGNPPNTRINLKHHSRGSRIYSFISRRGGTYLPIVNESFLHPLIGTLGVCY